jgi:hypothetical protein
MRIAEESREWYTREWYGQQKIFLLWENGALKTFLTPVR